MADLLIFPIEMFNVPPHYLISNDVSALEIQYNADNIVRHCMNVSIRSLVLTGKKTQGHMLSMN